MRPVAIVLFSVPLLPLSWSASLCMLFIRSLRCDGVSAMQATVQRANTRNFPAIPSAPKVWRTGCPAARTHAAVIRA
jgi:hypothetical protein